MFFFNLKSCYVSTAIRMYFYSYSAGIDLVVRIWRLQTSDSVDKVNPAL